MAKEVNCGKFLVIEASAAEMAAALGSPGICDYCGNHSRNGYLISVLNSWYCPKCFERWKLRAEYCPQDKDIEEKNYRYYKQLLRI